MSFSCMVNMLLNQQVAAGFVYCFGLEAKPLHVFSEHLCAVID